MKKCTILLLCIMISFVARSQKVEQYANNELIIKFTATAKVDLERPIETQRFNHQKVDALNKKFDVINVERTGNIKERKTYLITFKSKQNIEDVRREYERTRLFEYVEPNYIGQGGGQRMVVNPFPNDTHFSKQYGLYNDGQFPLYPTKADADIDMEKGWEIEKGKESIVVAVLDSGIKFDHPEFNGRIWMNTEETDNGKDDDANGYQDDLRGWDFVNKDNHPLDDQGHGTNVAGIIGAKSDNSLGFAGVDWNCKLMTLKILNDKNQGFYSWWSKAIYYAVDNGAKVINMSVGGSSYSQLLEEAINYAYNNGVVVVACMMNTDNNVKYYPAGFTNTIAVGSTNPDDQRSSPFFWSANSGSCYGNHIDVVAPGNYIYGLSHLSSSNYQTYWGGTSQATPLVAGLSSLLLAQDESRTPDDIRKIIRDTSEDQVGKESEDIEGFDPYYGYGRINAYHALQAIMLNTYNQKDIDKKSTLYPNPNNGFLTIESQFDVAAIQVTSVTGQVVLDKEFEMAKRVIHLNLSGLSKGIYQVRLIDKTTHIAEVQQIVIDR